MNALVSIFLPLNDDSGMVVLAPARQPSRPVQLPRGRPVWFSSTPVLTPPTIGLAGLILQM